VAKNENADCWATSELLAGKKSEKLSFWHIPVPDPPSPYAKTLAGIANTSATHNMFFNFIAKPLIIVVIESVDQLTAD
jgi:hypothetical protein